MLGVALHGCCGQVGGPRGTAASHHGALGGGEVDGVDARGQRLLQVVEDVGADGGAGGGALGGGGLVQQLLEGIQLDQQHHVLQEVALDEGGELRGTEELRWRQDTNNGTLHSTIFMRNIRNIYLIKYLFCVLHLELFIISI